MKVVITMRSEDVQQKDSLLVTNTLLRKDIIKDVIGSLPNILALDCGVTGNEEPAMFQNKEEHRICTNRQYHCYDIHDISSPLIKIVESNVMRYELADDGKSYDLSKPLPSMKIYYLEFGNSAFCKSIYFMIENYYKNDEGVEIQELTDDEKFVSQNPEGAIYFEQLDDADPQLYEILTSPDCPFNEKSSYFRNCMFHIFKGDKNEIQLNETAMSDRIFDVIRSKFSIVVPEGSTKYEKNVDENTILKCIIDEYDIYAMDSTSGLLTKILDITYSTFDSSGNRIGTIRAETVLATLETSIKFSHDLISTIIQYLK